MPLTGYLRCDGCDCRTQSVPADDTLHPWPLCENTDPESVPCHYIVKAKCGSSVTIDVPDCTGSYTWLLLCQVTLLLKECWRGCKWVHIPYCDTLAPGPPSLITWCLTDQVADAIAGAFPPASYPMPDGPLTFHKGDYRTSAQCLQTYVDEGPAIAHNWELVISSTAPGGVTFTLTQPDIVAWAAANGKTIPVYRNVNEWIPFGTNTGDSADPDFGNTMLIDRAGYDSFPMLPRSICVEAEDDTGVACENPCDSEEARRVCCDFLSAVVGCDTARFVLELNGCDGPLPAQELFFNRYYSADDLPCGPRDDFPGAHPCGVFWCPSISIGDAHCDGSDEAHGWTGAVGMMFWCEGTDPDNPYKGKAYCFNSFTNCWVSQGNVLISNFVCCPQPSFDISFPELDCCCATEPPITTTCCDSATPATLFGTVSGASCSAMNGTWTLVYDSGTNEWVGTRNILGDTIRMFFACQGSPWSCTIDHPATTFSFTSQTASATSCSPFLWSFAGASAAYDGAVAASCGASDTFTITVTE